jgi:hypothetical protein
MYKEDNSTAFISGLSEIVSAIHDVPPHRRICAIVDDYLGRDNEENIAIFVMR